MKTRVPRVPRGPRIIVTDGLWRKSLSAIRSIGKAGFEVAVQSDTVFSPGLWSRYVSKRQVAPSPLQDPKKFYEALKSLSQGTAEIPVLLPMEDSTLAWVSQERLTLAREFKFIIPSPEALAIAFDKNQTLQAARALGLECPLSSLARDPVEAAHILKELQGSEWVVKPIEGRGSQGVRYEKDIWNEEKWAAYFKKYGPCLIQERIPPQGRGLGACLLYDANGRRIAAFAHERLKQYPVTGGPSTDRRSIHAPELIEQSARLLESLSWHGVAMVEWKEDPRTRKAKLMEINPRFWGSLELAVRAGVDFPSLYARACLGEELPLAKPYTIGTRCRWLIPGEILRYASEPSETREGLRRFMDGIITLSEEWDSDDLPGALATIICTGALAFNPMYWKYLRRA